MELVQVANYLNGRYLLSDFKKDKKQILKGDLLASYSFDSLGTSNNEKIYYDTKDNFFATHGINIYTVLVNKVSKELVIRYDDSQVERIDFLRNIPNFFKVRIAKTDSIHKCYPQISEAIYKVYPAGLSENIEDKLRECRPTYTIHKKRESYKVVNNTGLKMTMSFDKCEYLGKGGKEKQGVLDIVGESFGSKEEFESFLKLVVRDFPQLIKLDNNELNVCNSLF